MADTGVPARTVTRILRRHGVPVPAACDPVTGHQIRATRHSDRRYDPPEPSAMIHLDVKKLGRIPDGGGRRVHGRSEAVRGRGIGYDHGHTAIDDHTHLAYAQVLSDEKSTTCAAFPTRAAAFFTAHGITRIHRVPTDNPPQPPHLGRLPTGLRRTGRPAEVHPAPLPVDPRKGRTPQPHPGHRKGLPAPLHQQRPAHPRPGRLARALQHPTPPTRPRAASHPSPDCHQDHDRVHLAHHRRLQHPWPYGGTTYSGAANVPNAPYLAPPTPTRRALLRAVSVPRPPTAPNYERGQRARRLEGNRPHHHEHPAPPRLLNPDAGNAAALAITRTDARAPYLH